MKSFVQLVGFSSGLLLCAFAHAQSYTGNQVLSKSEASQLLQDVTPQARAQLARREAYAAYNEAMSACKSMGQAERKDCAVEAKKNLRNDLNYAKEIRTSGGRMGGAGSGMGSSGGSVSGVNDVSSAGASSGSRVSGASGAGGMGGMSSGAGGNGMQESRPNAPQSAGMSNDSSQASAPVTAAEKQQFVQSFSPQAQYNLSKREAHAAYAEALKACKALDRAERSACTKDARATLQQDLAYAKRQMQESSGTSGMSGAGGSDKGLSGSSSR